MNRQPVERLTLRAREAAEALGVCARTLWRLSAPRGPIPCIYSGTGKRRTMLYPVKALQAWLDEQAAASTTDATAQSEPRQQAQHAEKRHRPSTQQ